jgi:HPt (histidine-containing phosphotransfer) domain-containing protein
MTKKPFPDLGRISAPLAKNLARVETFADRMSARVDQLVRAAGRDDWPRVAELAQDMAADSRRRGYRSVSALATRLQEEARRPNNATGARRGLIRLIGTVGRVSCG